MRIRILLIAVVVIVGVATAVVGAVGQRQFADAHMDPIGQADAIVVLGGEHDGREAYGIDLARQGHARTVLLSDPYGRHDRVMRRACAAGGGGIEILCFTPRPGTTQGEATYVQTMARERGWHHVIVISWRYHLPRIRYIFGKCFDGTISAVGVPRDYRFSAAQWAFVSAYQDAGFVKAAVLGCDDDAR